MSVLGPEALVACALGWLICAAWPADRPARRWGLLALSALVVWSWQPEALPVTVALTLICWAAVHLARRESRRAVSLWLGLVLLLGTLAAFRYGGEALDRGVAPHGLSFTVFRLTGALLDAVNLKLAVSGPQLLLLSLFFPSFLAGPITTLQSFGPLAPEDRDPAAALRRIFRGLCRKLLLADNLSVLVLTPWLRNGVEGLSPGQCLALPVLFGLRLYWDFAGYTDVALGAAALMGYRLPENFDRPYLSRNLVEFWRRWHVTLSEWIRLRLFMKMVGRRSPKVWLHTATVVSMALCGMWHGAGWGFLLWGVWHGVGLVAVHLFGDLQKASALARGIGSVPGAAAASTGLTFAYVSAGWLLFFLPPSEAAVVAARGLGALREPATWPGLWAAALCGLGVHALAARGWEPAQAWERVPAAARGCVYAVLTWGMVISAQPEPFVYFRF